MAYTPTTWANGDTITAAGLNKMEQGIAAGGLPTVTGADIGKSMVVQRGAASAGAVIVPQQTVSDEGSGEYSLSNVVADLFTGGRSIRLTIGEEVFDGVLQEDAAGFIFCAWQLSENESIEVGYEEGAGYLFYDTDDPPASITVSVNELTYAANWDKDYRCDMAIRLTGGFNDIEITGGTIISGSYDDLKTKLNEGTPINVIIITQNAMRSVVTVVDVGTQIEITMLWAITFQSGNPVFNIKTLGVAPDGTISGWWS